LIHLPIDPPGIGLQILIDAIPDIIFYKDLGGVYRAGNRAWGALIGRTVQATGGKTDFDLFPESLASFFRAKNQEMLASGKEHRNEEWVQYPDGHRDLLDTLKSPLINAAGQVVGLVGICRDITHRAAADAAAD
jgi:PAS domain S-box-containing protein